MNVRISICFLLIMLQACAQNAEQGIGTRSKTAVLHHSPDTEKELINPAGNTVETRILTPPGYARTGTENNSFQEYLRELPLKPHHSKVKMYDGRFKENYEVYDAVIDLA